MGKWVCDFIMYDKNISTIKGELLPILVKKQFSSVKPKTDNLDCDNVKRSILHFVPDLMTGQGGTVPSTDSQRYSCYAYRTGPCLRVNTVPSYWEANKRARAQAMCSQIHTQARVGERAQLSDCMVGMNCSVSDKTSLTNVCLGTGSRVEEKVRLSNCVVMDNVVIETGSIMEDSIICDSCTILGRGQKTAEGAEIVSQLVLDRDRMMEV